MIRNGLKKCGSPYVVFGGKAEIGVGQDCVVDREFDGLFLDAKVTCEMSAWHKDDEESGEGHEDDRR